MCGKLVVYSLPSVKSSTFLLQVSDAWCLLCFEALVSMVTVWAGMCTFIYN